MIKTKLMTCKLFMMYSETCRRSALSGSNQTRERHNQEEMNMNRGEVHVDTSPHCAFGWSEGVQLKYVTSGNKESVSCHLRSLKEGCLTVRWKLRLCFIKKQSQYWMEGYSVREEYATECFEPTTIVQRFNKYSQRTFLQYNSISQQKGRHGNLF